MNSIDGKIDVIGKPDIYFLYPFLRGFREMLGDLEDRDILGEGMNAIIIRHSTLDNLVIKIAKPGKTDKLETEYKNHNKFFHALQDGFTNYHGDLSESVRIPKLSESSENPNSYFMMELIRGQNLATKFYRQYYSKELSVNSKEFLDGMTDWQFGKLMEKLRLPKVPVMQLEGDFTGKMIGKEMKYFFKFHTHGTELGNVLDFLEWKGLRHDDLHPGNIMEDWEGNAFIIDFGRTIIKKMQLETAKKISNIL